MRISNSYYYDHQATCPLDSRVFDKMSHLMANSVGNAHSSEHAFGWESEKAVADAKAKIGAMVGCDNDEIFFTSGATEANNLALKGFDYGTRNTLMHTSIEHKCVIETGRYLQEREGLNLISIGVDEEGYANLDELTQLADENVGIFSFIGVHNEVGTIQNFQKIADICRRYDIKIHADMAQAPLAISLPSIIDHIDTLSLSAHKYYGPMGIGCLYIRRDIQHLYSPIIHGGGQQEGMRSGTIPVPLAVGMGEASKIIVETETEGSVLRDKNKLLWEGLKTVGAPAVLNGPDISKRHPANLNVSFMGFDSADIIAAVQPQLAISSGSACTTGYPEPSHVLQNMGLSADRVSSAVRMSLGRQTSEDDIHRAVQILGRVLERLPKAA
ncbi:MAG: cysteine desulfurase [Parasphingorhabdus sp.]|jgi:cysteine desulfurase|uniref:cysteine desulfurase family protein n=1 Tax=Parasphingorhabdus sp. TaxID=2709688 RepID=UPI0039E3EEE8